MNRTDILKRLTLSLVVTLALIALFLYFIPLSDILGGLYRFEITWAFLPAFLLAVLGNIYIRGATLALLVNSPEPVPSIRWLTLSATHNASTSLSGMIFGDALLFWLLNRFDIHWKKSLFITLLMRVFEVPPLLLFLFLGLVGASAQLPGRELWGLLAGIAFVASMFLLFFLDTLLARLPHKLWLGQGEKVADLCVAYRQVTARCMRPLLVYSFLKIALSLLYFLFVFRFFSIELDFWQVCLVFGIFNFATALPIQGVAGLGTFEAYFSAGLILLGWASATALALALLIHMLFLGSFLLIALLCFLLLMATGSMAGAGRSG